MRKIGRVNRISLSKWKKGVTKTPEKIMCSWGENIMKMCLSCKTIAMGETPTKCPNCGESFPYSNSMNVNS